MCHPPGNLGSGVAGASQPRNFCRRLGNAPLRARYSSIQTSTKLVPWKWLGDMVQPLIFLLCDSSLVL
jgi:hypothetical protein